MSRPRKPIGPNPPGRLLGTMVKVLAAEMSDQSRLSRGKRYWSDDAVIDIVVGHGAVTAEVQGSRPEPYVVTVEASGGEGIPSKREIWAQCTCPDDAGTGVDLCKHAVAVFFSLADEITVEPDLVARWRAGRRFARDEPVASLPAPGTSRRDEDEFENVRDDGDGGRDAEVIPIRPRVDAEADAISALLAAPAGAAAPSFPSVTDLDHGVLRRRRLGEVLDDCLEHLAIRWE